MAPHERAIAPFTFRELRERDLPQILAIERRLFRTPWDRAAFRVFQEPGAAFSQVALDGETVAGYVLGWCIATEAELANLAVDIPWQRRSLGSALVSWTLATCARRGATDVFLEVRLSNVAAQRLYSRHGFEVHARRANYYRNPREDALVLRARVAPAGAD